jgi:hypothetical protein
MTGAAQRGRNMTPLMDNVNGRANKSEKREALSNHARGT